MATDSAHEWDGFSGCTSVVTGAFGTTLVLTVVPKVVSASASAEEVMRSWGETEMGPELKMMAVELEAIGNRKGESGVVIKRVAVIFV